MEDTFRRQFAAGCTFAGVTALAGCTGTGSDPEANESETTSEDRSESTSEATSGDFFEEVVFTEAGTIEVYVTETGASQYPEVEAIALASADGTRRQSTDFSSDTADMVEFSNVGYRGDIRFQAQDGERTVVAESGTYTYEADVSIAGFNDITPVNEARDPDAFRVSDWIISVSIRNDGNAPQRISRRTIDDEPLPYQIIALASEELYTESEEPFVARPNTTTTAFSLIQMELRYGTPEDGEYETTFEIANPEFADGVEMEPLTEPVIFEFSGSVEDDLYTYPETVDIRLA